jgi:hypothetical protein
MSETIRTTRNTFDALEARLRPLDAGLVERIKAGAKIRTQEVAFTVEPGSEDAKTIAFALADHTETGRVGTALDRIRAVCLGQSAPAETAEKPAAETVRIDVAEKREPVLVGMVKAESEKKPEPEKKAEDDGFVSADFKSWREMVGDLAAASGVQVEPAKKTPKKKAEKDDEE